jgi:hypothetical protein
MSASSTPVLAPSAASASARFTATVDLPTPLVLPARQLQDALGIRTVAYHEGEHALAVKEERLT